MPILYEDSFQSDIDLCRVLRAIRLDDPGDDNPSTPPLHPAPTSVVVDDNDYYPLLDQDPRRWVDISQPTNDSANAGPGDRTTHESTSPLPSPVTSGANVLDIAAGQTISRARAGQSPAPFERKSYVAYVVFEGLMPGIYDTWSECERQVKGVSCNNFKGFKSRREAERCYVLAGALGSLYIRSRDPSVPRILARPISEAVLHAFGAADDDFLGADWHVVTKGKRPGVYPAWNFAATQTIGVPGAKFNKYLSKLEAMEAFEKARHEGLVTTL